MPVFSTADGTEIFYRDWGSGPPVVLIHGWPLNADMWEYQVPALISGRHRVIAYDRRGFGRSGQPWFGYDYDTLAADLHALLDHLDLRNALLVGFSMGGGEVARYVANYGSYRIARTALISSVTPYLMKDASNPDGVDPSVFESLVEGLERDRPHLLSRFTNQLYGVHALTSPVSEEYLRWSHRMALTASPRATMACVRALSATDFRDDMTRFRLPTLVVHGTADATVPIEVSGRRVSQMISDVHYREYRGAPHGLFMTHKDRLAADLVEFAAGRHVAS